MHLDCSSVCRGRCGYTNGAPKQAVSSLSTNDGADCLCVFGGASQCWVPARTQRALTLADGLPVPASKAAKGDTATAGGSSKQVKGAQSETSEVVEPADAVNVDAEMLHKNTAILDTEHEIQIESGSGPGAQGEQGQQENALQLAQRKSAPIKQFSPEQAEELLSQLTTSEMRTRIIARAVEDISLADEAFANRM